MITDELFYMKTNYFAPKQQTPANNVEPRAVQGTSGV